MRIGQPEGRCRAAHLPLGPSPAQDYVAVALSRPAHSPQTVDRVGRQPDVSLAALVDAILVAHPAEQSVAQSASRFDADRTDLARSG